MGLHITPLSLLARRQATTALAWRRSGYALLGDVVKFVLIFSPTIFLHLATISFKNKQKENLQQLETYLFYE